MREVYSNLEFLKGKSLNFFADILEKKNDKRIIIGFDSWKGFSEEWSGINNLY